MATMLRAATSARARRLSGTLCVLVLLATPALAQGAGSQAPLTTPAPATQPAAPQTLRVTPAAGHRVSGTSTGAIVLAVLAGVLLIACAAWALARAAGWQPRWTLDARHSVAEAGHRLSSTWAELADWARLGR
jgi:hypothetical protein